MGKKLKVLLVTSMPWRDDNNIGNSYSNIFRGLDENVEFAHIYCRSGMPQNKICKKYFRIDESKLVTSLFNNNYKLGESFIFEDSLNEKKEEFSSTYNKMRILRWEVFFLARNILWDLAEWKNEQLDSFIEDFEPDIVFGTLTYMPNINKMMTYIKKKYNIPLVVYAWDDVYSLKQFSLSPFYWLRRFSQRKWIKACVAEADCLYTITDLMKKEYSQYFNKECKLLYKGYYFYEKPVRSRECDEGIDLVFMGNLGAGRWRTLAKLVEVLQRISTNESKATLRIYSLSPISKKMEKMLAVDKVSSIMPVVPNEEVLLTMESADILVHVEPLSLKDRLFYRLSFSTKIVDYFYAGRCILGLGKQTASMDYLIRNDAGIVVDDIRELQEILGNLLRDPKAIREYGRKAWECGVRNHQIQSIQKKLALRSYKYCR